MEHAAQTELVRLDQATAVPLRRLGALLQAARGGTDLDEVARRSAGRYAPVDLVEIEQGHVDLSDDEVTGLLDLYGADPGELVASRSTLVIDVHEGTVAAGPWSTSFSPEADTADDVLSRYLALVYEMRGLPPGTPVPLRSLDVSVLSSALAISSVDVEHRLHVLMETDDGAIERLRTLLRAKVLVPAIGLVVGVTGLGVLVLVPGSGAAPGTELGRAVAATATDSAVVIGEGLTIEAPEATPAPTPAPAPEGDTGTGTGALTEDPAAPPPESPAPAAPDPGEVVLGDGLSVEAPEPVAPPVSAPAVAPDDEVVLGDGLTIERSDLEP
ncbi:MAG: hypothetical protein ACLFRV_07110 [Acidimicrobiales bacterium]